MPPLIEADDVTFRYGSRTALDGLSFSLPHGATGLLGPNGAGKTTLVRLIVGHLPVGVGKLWVQGLDAALDSCALRATLGLAPEGDVLVPGLSGVAYVAYAGRLAGLSSRAAMDRAHMALHHVGLGADRYRRVEEYSKGMRQRLKLAQALVHDPSFLILDEPTDGMDPGGRDEMLELLANLVVEHGKNMLLCTHILDDVQRVCQRALVISKGKAMGCVELDRAARGVDTYQVVLTGAVQGFADSVRQHGVTIRVDDEGEGDISIPQGEVDTVIALGREAGVEFRRLLPARERLEDLFARLVRTEP
ncbi:ABC transporter ATP-binding protein [Candidatus Fermentibacteria bacterium]|nr:ABC transporter ATP-binding protein [Candidatus Fermentibacteria bacterium]